MSKRIVCPICESDDQIEIVFALYNRGIKRTTGTGDVWVPHNEGWGGSYQTVNLNNVEIADLSQILAPPPEPKQDKGFGCIAWTLFLIIFPSGCFLSLYDVSLFLERPSSHNISIRTVLFSLLIIWFIWKHFKRRRVGKRNYDAQLPGWQRAMQIWNRLYYCYRNGIVFDPDTGRYIDSRYMNQLLN